MTRIKPDLGGAARAGLYVFAFSLIFWPLTDLILNVWPPQPGNVQWRYGFSGLLASFLHTPMLGLLLALAVAWQGRQRRVLWFLGILQVVAAVAMVGIVSLFALDLLQVRGFRPPDSLPAMFVGGAVSGGKYLVAATALAFLGTGTIRMARRFEHGSRTVREAGDSRLVSSPTRTTTDRATGPATGPTTEKE